MFVCKGCFFFFREVLVFSSEGEEKKFGKSVLVVENMFEMFVDSKLFFDIVIY